LRNYLFTFPDPNPNPTVIFKETKRAILQMVRVDCLLKKKQVSDIER